MCTVNFIAGDLIKLNNNKILLCEPEWHENIKASLQSGDIVITLSNIVDNGFINVITQFGVGWLYKENDSFKKVI